MSIQPASLFDDEALPVLGNNIPAHVQQVQPLHVAHAALAEQSLQFEKLIKQLVDFTPFEAIDRGDMKALNRWVVCRNRTEVSASLKHNDDLLTYAYKSQNPQKWFMMLLLLTKSYNSSVILDAAQDLNESEDNLRPMLHGARQFHQAQLQNDLGNAFYNLLELAINSSSLQDRFKSIFQRIEFLADFITYCPERFAGPLTIFLNKLKTILNPDPEAYVSQERQSLIDALNRLNLKLQNLIANSKPSLTYERFHNLLLQSDFDQLIVLIEEEKNQEFIKDHGLLLLRRICTSLNPQKQTVVLALVAKDVDYKLAISLMFEDPLLKNEELQAFLNALRDLKIPEPLCKDIDIQPLLLNFYSSLSIYDNLDICKKIYLLLDNLEKISRDNRDSLDAIVTILNRKKVSLDGQKREELDQYILLINAKIKLLAK